MFHELCEEKAFTAAEVLGKSFENVFVETCGLFERKLVEKMW